VGARAAESAPRGFDTKAGCLDRDRAVVRATVAVNRHHRVLLRVPVDISDIAKLHGSYSEGKRSVPDFVFVHYMGRSM